MPTVYEEQVRYELGDDEYRQWLITWRLLVPSVSEVTPMPWLSWPTLRMDWKDRQAADTQMFEGRGLEMALPQEQVPDFILDLWERRARRKAN